METFYFQYRTRFHSCQDNFYIKILTALMQKKKTVFLQNIKVKLVQKKNLPERDAAKNVSLRKQNRNSFLFC